MFYLTPDGSVATIQDSNGSGCALCDAKGRLRIASDSTQPVYTYPKYSTTENYLLGGVSPEIGTTGGGLSRHYTVKVGPGKLYGAIYVLDINIPAGSYYCMAFDSADAPVSGVSKHIGMGPLLVPVSAPNKLAYIIEFQSVSGIQFINGLTFALSNTTSLTTYNNSYTDPAYKCIVMYSYI